MIFNSMQKETTRKLENVAIIGNGGRENSLAWIVEKNEKIKNIYLIPGNGGSINIKKCKRLKLDYKNIDVFVKKLIALDIDLVIIGPEIPLAYGLGDLLRKNNFLVFGPNQDGAKLESSKSWAKSFMHDANIPTANFWEISSIDEAKKVIERVKEPLVVKADGLASGKGVFIPDSKEETLQIAQEILKGKFGSAGKKVLFEEKIEGPEVSIFALCDGERYILLPSAQDHKRLEENDKGLNTGGMGAYSPTPIISKSQLSNIKNVIIEPTINELIKKNINYRGVIYFGLMITNNGPKVIEYNCRFGDPECQTIMPLMDKSFVSILHKCAQGNLKGNEITMSKNSVSGCVIAAAKGYPISYEKGKLITFLGKENKQVQIFHSGTEINSSGETYTDGGRVLSIICQGKDFDEAFKLAYETLNEIKFEGIYYRKDIGHQVRNLNRGENS